MVKRGELGGPDCLSEMRGVQGRCSYTCSCHPSHREKAVKAAPRFIFPSPATKRKTNERIKWCE